MQEILLYDPERRPPDWTDILRPGQYAVFLSDIVTDVERTPAGRYLQGGDQSTCLVFDSLPEAEAYCEERVESCPRVRCDIYDHTGKSKPPMLTYVNKAQLKTPRKFAHWGLLLVAASIVCFWLEWRRGSGLGLALIIGINLLFAGLRLFYWGAGSSEKRQSNRED
jgi:hypothetical protein